MTCIRALCNYLLLLCVTVLYFATRVVPTSNEDKNRRYRGKSKMSVYIKRQRESMKIVMKIATCDCSLPKQLSV